MNEVTKARIKLLQNARDAELLFKYEEVLEAIVDGYVDNPESPESIRGFARQALNKIESTRNEYNRLIYQLMNEEST